MPKGKSGIKRGVKKGVGHTPETSRVQTSQNSSVSQDKTYAVTSEVGSRITKAGKFKRTRKAQSEGFKAIYDAPEGTRFSVSYLFGGDSLYEVRMRGGNTKVVQYIDSDGRARYRYRTIRSVADVRKLFGKSREITVHRSAR